MAPGVVFFITLNEGYEYVGTNPIDEALRDRMTYSVRMSYVPRWVETSILVRRTAVDDDTAGELTEFARSVRRNPKTGVHPPATGGRLPHRRVDGHPGCRALGQ